MPTLRVEGEAERLGDILLVCNGGNAGASSLIDITVTLPTNVTSRVLNTATAESEALLLIDEPQPGVVDTSNGFEYNGQVLGKPGIAAGQPGSGNAYLGRLSSSNSVTWTFVPFVEPGPSSERYLRITNLRANATTVPMEFGLGWVQATVSATIPVTNPAPNVGVVSANSFTFSGTITSPSAANLTFTESFATAFAPRIEATSSGAPERQDLPGVVYWTESQFTPCFSFTSCSSPPQSPIGLASTATLLETRISHLGSAAAFLSVPNQVIENFAPGITEELNLMSGGKPVTSPGNTLLTVTSGAVDLIYEVVSANAYALDQFVIGVALLGSTMAPLPFPANTVFDGYLAPVNSTGTASPTAPEPRFVESSPAGQFVHERPLVL